MQNSYFVLTRNIEINSNAASDVTVIKSKTYAIKVSGDTEFVSAILKVLERPTKFSDLIDILYSKSESDIKTLVDDLVLHGAVIKFKSENDLLSIYTFLSGHLDKVTTPPIRVRPLSCNSVDIKGGNSSTNHLLEYISNRKSGYQCTNPELSSDKLISIFRSAYGYTMGTNEKKEHRTVPAAGALYSLSLFLYLKREDNKYSLYRYEPESNILRFIETYEVSIVDLCNGQETVVNARGLIMYSYLPSANVEKYGERALFFSLLEAGHSAQNATLMAAYHNLGARCIGAFDTRYTDQILEVDIGIILYGVAIY